VPAALGPPDAVRVDDGRVALVYAPRPGLPARRARGIGLLVVQQRGGDLIAEKLVGPGTRVESVDVDGAPGAWIAGDPHVIVFFDERGQVRQEALRLAGDTLVWERGRLLVRVEGASSRERALAVARSLR
jgi:hypothetical protein